MGTETLLLYQYVMSLFYVPVKLNNPLMGTETKYFTFKHINIFVPCSVKLNNPLMGTETNQQNYISLLFHNR